MENSAKFALTADDLVAGMRLHSLSSLLTPKVLISWLILWVIAVVYLYWLGTDGAPFDLASLLANPMLLVIATLPFVIIPALVMIVGPINTRRMYREQCTLHGEMTLAWSADALHIESEYGTFDIPWSHFLGWLEDKRSFALLESRRLIRVIPKRALTAEQRDDLRACFAGIGRREPQSTGIKQ